MDANDGYLVLRTILRACAGYYARLLRAGFESFPKIL